VRADGQRLVVSTFLKTAQRRVEKALAAQDEHAYLRLVADGASSAGEW
jgi:hypothetical protein